MRIPKLLQIQNDKTVYLRETMDDFPIGSSYVAIWFTPEETQMGIGDLYARFKTFENAGLKVNCSFNNGNFFYETIDDLSAGYHPGTD